MTARLTAKQREAALLLGSQAANVMLYGGSRSGKTFVICWRLAHNAISCPGSRQAILRKHLNSVRTSIGDDTLPKVLEIEQMRFGRNHVDNKFVFPNGSEIWLLGLDDKERTEKVLGKEFFAMYFNECSEMTWDAVRMAMTRNSMKISRDILGKARRNRLYFDCNPPSKRHWCYKAFVQKVDPVKNTPWKNVSRWDYFQMNPVDNRVNIGDEYVAGVLDEYSGKLRQRFLEGVFTDDVENALWRAAMIDPYRIATVPADLDRIVVGVDPAVTNTENSDMTGIVVAGKKKIGNTEHYYILDDRTMKGSPESWAASVTTAYEHWKADRIVVETNNGGDLVESVLRNTRRHLPITKVHAKRGKTLRAEPVAGIYEKGWVHHVGEHPELEDQMCSFIGDDGEKSPDNLDAMIYAMSALSGLGPAVATVGSYKVM